jgi:calmodulin
MSNKLNQAQIDDIRKNFDFFYDDANGQIDLKEFLRLLKILEPNSTKSQAEQGFLLIDNDNNGVIDFDEFMNWWATCWWQY